MKKGFTLAEIMIVLAVIGVLTAILLPVAINSTPNENVMKFKKGHNVLLSAIRELVNSDKYYLDGDLGRKPDGSYVISSSYFCDTLAELINTQEKNFPTTFIETLSGFWNKKEGILNGRFSFRRIGRVLATLCRRRTNHN